jgi:hypothetical protein
MNDQTFKAFKHISNFISALAEEYGNEYRPLKLYHHLLNKTRVNHTDAIAKHIKLFGDFCVANREAISEKNATNLKDTVISYSQKVSFDFTEIFKIVKKEDTDMIWSHILTISAVLDPAGKAKEILQKSPSNESDFLSNIITKVEENVSPDADPVSAVASLMNSGILTDMMTGMQSGSLDMGKLLGVAQGMISTLGQGLGDDPESKQTAEMLSNMNGMIANMQNGGAPPDIMGLMSMMNNTPKPK